MDLSKLKDIKGIFKKAAFLKNYTKLLIPVVITLVAVVFLAVTPMLAGGLKDQIEDNSIDAARELESLRRDPFPMEQWKVEQEYQSAYESDVNKINKLAIQTTQRELLNYEIFPEPKKESVMLFRQEFGRQYHASLEKLADKVNGQDCPSEAEIKQRIERSSGEGGGRMRRSLTGRNPRSSQRGQEEIITDVLCKERAQSSGVYLSVNQLPGYFFWDDYQYESLEIALADCWYSQLAYWVVEDIITTAGKMNSSSASVLNNPVKRIVSIEFEPGSSSRRSGRRSDTSSAANPLPAYVTSEENWLTNSITGRVSDETLDILHFETSVVVDSRRVLEFMNTLCSGRKHTFRGFDGNSPAKTFMHNQITVLESDAVSFNRQEGEHLRYRYGEAPVVRLDLTCEYQFYKAGYEEIKPEVVKQAMSPEEEDMSRRY